MFKRIRRTRTECAEHSFKAVNLSCRLIQLPNSAVKYCAAKNCKRVNRVNNTVAVHIRHLREKIEIDPSEPRCLKVLFGQGYMIEEGMKR